MHHRSRHWSAILLAPAFACAPSLTLYQAVERGNLDAVRHYVDQDRSQASARDADGVSMLTRAVDRGDREMALYLLDAGADVHAKGPLGCEVIHAAAMTGFAIIDELLGHGADVNSVCEGHGWTPLHVVTSYSSPNQTAVTARLLARGADVGARDKKGATPLWHATRGVSSARQVIELLVEHNADVNAADGDGTTPLHRAAFYKDATTAIYFLEHGANPEARDKKGDTSLHIAITQRALEVVTALLDAGADIDSQDTKGLSPLHRAAVFGQVEIAQLLLARGARLDQTNAEGDSPLQVAMEHGQERLARLIYESWRSHRFARGESINNVPPAVVERGAPVVIVEADVFNAITGVTVRFAIDAFDVDGEDELDITWHASNGKLSANDKEAEWQRSIQSNVAVPGTVSVRVKDQQGAISERTWDMN